MSTPKPLGVRIGHTVAKSAIGLLACICVLVGGIAASSVLTLYERNNEVSAWVAVPATIHESELVTEGAAFRVKVRYTYEFEGETIERSRVGIDGGASSGLYHVERFELIDHARVTEQPFNAWVDPNKPNRSVLFRELPGNMTVRIVIPLIFGGGGIIWLAGMVISIIGDWRPPSPTPKKDKGTLAFAFIGVPFTAVGAMMLIMVTGWHWQASDMKSWQQVPATIEVCGLVGGGSSVGRSSSSQTLYAIYTYEVNGEDYKGHRVGIEYGSVQGDPIHERLKLLEQHRDSKEPFMAWVNPSNPGQAVLFREIVASSFALIAFGLVFFFIGLPMVVFAVILWLGKRETANPA